MKKCEGKCVMNTCKNNKPQKRILDMRGQKICNDKMILTHDVPYNGISHIQSRS